MGVVGYFFEQNGYFATKVFVMTYCGETKKLLIHPLYFDFIGVELMFPFFEYLYVSRTNARGGGGGHVSPWFHFLAACGIYLLLHFVFIVHASQSHLHKFVN